MIHTSSVLAGVAGALVTLATLAGITFLKAAPTWSNQLSKSWRWLNSVSLVVATVAASLSVVASNIVHASIWESCTAAVSITALVFCFTQSCFTDPPLHLVDRYTLLVANILSFCMGFAFLYAQGNKPLLGVYIALAMVAGALILIPSGVGPSDGRAFLLSICSVFPIGGLNNLKWGLVIMFVTLIATSLIMLARRSTTFLKGLKGVFSEKMRIPAVPIILGSMMLVQLSTFAQCLVK